MCSVKELCNVAYLQLLLMKWCILVCTTVTVFLKCSIINSCCFSVNLYVVGLQKQSGKKYLEGPGKCWKSSGI